MSTSSRIRAVGTLVVLMALIVPAIAFLSPVGSGISGSPSIVKECSRKTKSPWLGQEGRMNKRQCSFDRLGLQLTAANDDNAKTEKTLPVSLLLRVVAAALFLTTASNVTEQTLSTIAVRLSTSAITVLDFAPTATKQWKETSQALSANPSRAVRKFFNLVRFKTVGELLGLGFMVAFAEWACLGASLVLTSHLLFWLAGGGPSRVDSSGNAAPLPPALIKSIFIADSVLLIATLTGTLAPSFTIRSAAGFTYSSLIALLCGEKLKSAFSKTSKSSSDKSKKSRENKVPDPPESTNLLADEGSGNSTEPWEFVWRENWYPLAFSRVTEKDIPHRLELFGEHLVLWHNGTQWAALADECPHRLAPLSEGRIDEEGQIECPYHGWTFTNQGTCTKIPQAVTADNNAKVLGACSARSFQVVEKQGIIWAWGRVGATQEEADESLVPICPALADDRFVWIDFSRDLPYSADVLLENILDPSHVPFTHHKTISRRDTAKPLPLALTTPVTAKGFEGQMEDVPVGKMGEENAKQGLVTERTTGFVAPSYMRNTIRSADPKDMDFDKGRESWTVVYATPTGPGRSRLLARFPFRFPPPPKRRFFFRLNIPTLIFKNLPDWINHMGQLKVTDDDNIFLPIQERLTQDAGGWRRYRMPTDADMFVRGYRRWFDQVGPPPYSPFAFDDYRMTVPTREQLLDRKSQHTKHCSSCRGALKNAARVKSVMQMALIASVAVSPTFVFHKAWKALGGVAVAALIISQVRRGASFVEKSLTSGLVDYPPPRNRSEMKGGNKELRTVEEGRKF